MNSCNLIVPIESRGLKKKGSQNNKFDLKMWLGNVFLLHLKLKIATFCVVNKHIWDTSVFCELSWWSCLILEGRLGTLCYHAAKVSPSSSQAKRRREQGKQQGVGNLRELNGPCNPALSSHWQMKWSCVSHLTSRLIFLIAEEGWRIIHHLANLSSSVTSWKNSLSDSDGWLT